MDVSREILNNLFGPDRNKTANEIKMKYHYSNRDVCKPFLICFCFHTLFPNTAYDDGVCKYKHDPFLKNMFDMDAGRGDHERAYLIQCINWIQKRLIEVQIRIKKNKELIEIKSNNPTERPKEIVDRLLAVDEEIEDTIKQAEELVGNGQIFDGERCMNDVERLREKKKEIEQMGDNLTTTLKVQKICDVCGAIQVINDTEKRLQTHLQGKIHQGFLRLRHQIQTLKIRLEMLNNLQPVIVKQADVSKNVQTRKKSKSKSPQKDSQKTRLKQKEEEPQKPKVDDRKKEKDGDKDLDKRRQKDGQRQRDRDKDKHKQKDRERERDGHKDREREKDREKDRDRDRDRDRERQRERDRDKDRKDRDSHRNRDGDRQRSRDKKQKKRDNDRSRQRRDRSGSHHKRKHKKDSYS